MAGGLISNRCGGASWVGWMRGIFYNKESPAQYERWGAGVAQKNVREEVGGWGRVPFNEPYAPSLSTIYDGA